MISIQEQTKRRRPLAARALPVWSWLVARLADSRLTPNQVSVIGMIAGLGGGVLLALTAALEPAGIAQRLSWLAVVLLVLVRGACNIFDGVLAVETGRASRLGLVYNEVPDRITDAAMLVGAGLAAGGTPLLGWAAAFGSLATAYLRVQVQLAGASADYCGPMAKPARMAVIVVALLALATGPTTWSLADRGPMTIATAIIVAGTAFTALRRLVRAARQLKAEVAP